MEEFPTFLFASLEKQSIHFVDAGMVLLYNCGLDSLAAELGDMEYGD